MRYQLIVWVSVLLLALTGISNAVVDNPMTADLDGGGHSITNLADIVTEGPWVDVRSYGSFSAAISATGSQKKTLLIPNQQNITANITIPANVSLKFLQGGSMSISSGVTATVKGSIEAGFYQIFSGSGSVRFGSGAVAEIYPEWWGAKADGTSPTVTTAAIQSAINAATCGAAVRFSAGRYAVEDTDSDNKIFTFPTFTGGSPLRTTGPLLGTGSTHLSEHVDRNPVTQINYGTIIQAEDNFDGALFYCNYARQLVWKDMTLLGPGKNTSGSIAIHLDQSNSQLELENIEIYGWETCIQTSNPSATGSIYNNDLTTYTNCFLKECIYGVKCYNSMAFQHRFFGGSIHGEYAWYSTAGAGGNAGVIGGQFYGVEFASNNEIFHFSGSSQVGNMVAVGCHIEPPFTAEEPPTLVYATSSAGGRIPITITGCFINFSHTDWVGSSKEFINISGTGPVSLTNNLIMHHTPIIRAAGMPLDVTFKNNFWLNSPKLIDAAGTGVALVSREQETYRYIYAPTGGEVYEEIPGGDSFIQSAYGEQRRWSETTAVPTSGSFGKGSVINYVASDGLMARSTVVTEGGTMGTLNGGATTGSISSGSNQLTVSDSTGIYPGVYLQVAGVTGTRRRVIGVSGTTITLSSNASASASGTVSYAAPVMASVNSYGSTFTMTAGQSTKTVSNSRVSATSRIIIMPTNASAGTLQRTNGLHISAKTAGSSFTVATSNGTAAAGTETFDYIIVE